MTFRVGQKVVCVRVGEWVGFQSGEAVPKVRGIYTIREITPPFGDYSHPDLKFVELTNTPRGYSNQFTEAVFGSEHFRPLQTISQADDVAMIKGLVLGMTPTERLDRLAELLDTTTGVWR